MTAAAAFSFLRGDDWPMPVTYTDPNGMPIDLTGGTLIGELYVAYAPAPILLTAASGGIVNLDAVNGKATFLAGKAMTVGVAPDKVGATAFPTRLQIVFTNSLGYRETIAIFTIWVGDPRAVDPSTLPQSQAGSVVAVSMQGPPGPAGAAGIAGYTKPEVDDLIAGLQNQINAIASQVAAMSAAASVPQTTFFRTVFSPLLLS